VFDDVGHSCKTVYSTNPILCSFNAKQVANGGMGLNEPQNYSALGKFSITREFLTASVPFGRMTYWMSGWIV
jgi:hypothetical protein